MLMLEMGDAHAKVSVFGASVGDIEHYLALERPIVKVPGMHATNPWVSIPPQMLDRGKAQVGGECACWCSGWL